MSDEERSGKELTDGSGVAVLTEVPASDSSRIISRRWLLFKSAIALNGLVGIVLAVPVLRYLFAPWRKDASYDSWVSLGPADAFPAGHTRLASYKNPAMNPWDGETDNVACYVRNAGGNQFQVFAINCAHLGCPVRWFPRRSSSCVRATVEPITRTVRGPQVRPSAGCSPTTGSLQVASCISTRARCRHSQTRRSW